MRDRLKYVFKRLIICFIWVLFIEGSELEEPRQKYIYIGEFDGVKIYHSENLKKSYTDMVQENLNKTTHYENVDLLRKK